MTLSSLFIVCSHGRRSAHDTHRDFDAPLEEARPYEWCPGGRPATLEDLGGEKVWWCEEHQDIWPAEHYDEYSCRYADNYINAFRRRPGDCEFVERVRILIPLPQMVAE